MKNLLRKVRNRIFGEPKRPINKPLKFYNLHSWIYETVKLDLREYRKRQRPKTWHRFGKMLSPNLSSPIFIIGAPRSGTTFLGSCIGEIPEISYHFEPVISKAAVRYVAQNQWNLSQARWFYKTVYSWLMRLHFDADLRFAEKTPRNSFIISTLYKMFPDAKFIYILRDGRDGSLSLSQKIWYDSDTYLSGLYQPGGYPFGSMARFWVEEERKQEYETTDTFHRCIWVWRSYVENALKGISSLPQESLYFLKYEELAVNPEKEADGILDFLDIESIESRQLFHREIAKVYPNYVGKWQQKLSESELIASYKEAGKLLNKLGYIDFSSRISY